MTAWAWDLPVLTPKPWDSVLSPLPTAPQASMVGLFPSPQALVQGAAQQGKLSPGDLSRDENRSPRTGQNRTALPVGVVAGGAVPRAACREGRN